MIADSRGPGSPSNAPRTVLVQSHIRGARFFEDATLLPAVTIRFNCLTQRTDCEDTSQKP